MGARIDRSRALNYAAFQAVVLQAKRVKKTWFLWYGSLARIRAIGQDMCSDLGPVPFVLSA
ncbi:hypothetical protein QUB75_22530 [Microcoleus sp. K1-B6]|uniref:hypothetical protein n=1 Tax=unclassified Microcoleus TaxID=2642155 RepID=UPI002FD2F960